MFGLLISLVATPSMAAGFGGGGMEVSTRTVDGENTLLFGVSVESYVDSNAKGAMNWGGVSGEYVLEDTADSAIGSWEVSALEGWRRLGSGRIELPFSAAVVSKDAQRDLLDVELARGGFSIPIYGDWVRLLIEGDLRLRDGGGSDGFLSSAGLPISVVAITPTDRPGFMEFEVEYRPGLTISGSDETITWDLNGRFDLGYGLVQERGFRLRAYASAEMEVYRLTPDLPVVGQRVGGGITLRL